MTKARFALLLVVTAGIGLLLAAGVRAEPPGGEGEGAEKQPFVRTVPPGAKNNWVFECTALSGGLNTNLDCDDPFPNNEPDIVVDPSDPQHMIASSNDYGSCCDQYYTTFDGGSTWSTGNMSTETTRSRTGSDPVTAFDVKHGVAMHSSLNYSFNDDGEACDGDVVVSVSTDGGLTWDPPAVVDFGSRLRPRPVQLFNDKEWIATDNNPPSPLLRAHVPDLDAVRGACSGSSSSRRSWSPTATTAASTGPKPQEISGSNAASARSRRAAQRASATRTSSPSRRSAATARSTSLS